MKKYGRGKGKYCSIFWQILFRIVPRYSSEISVIVSGPNLNAVFCFLNRILNYLFFMLRLKYEAYPS